MKQPKQSLRGNLDNRIHSIIRGAERNDLGEVKRALEEDPECVNHQDARMGITALHIAAADGNMPLVKLLLEQRNIKASRADHAGRDAAYMAEAIGRDDIANLITHAIHARLLERFPELKDVPNDDHEEVFDALFADEPEETQVISFPGRPPRPSGP